MKFNKIKKKLMLHTNFCLCIENLREPAPATHVPYVEISVKKSPLEMANKPVPVGITRTRPRFDENPRFDWVWVWVWVIPEIFNWGWG